MAFVARQCFWQTAPAVKTGHPSPSPRPINQGVDKMLNQRTSRCSQGAFISASGGLYGGVTITALLSTLMLSACGDGIVDDIVDDLTCAVTNCKQSSSLNVADISPRFKVTQEGGRVRVEGRLGQSANLMTVVQPSGSDHLSASLGAERRDLKDEDGKRTSYSVVFVDSSEQPTVSVNFVRGSELHTSTVSFPKPFALVAPTGTPMIARSAGKFLVQMSQPYASQMALSVSMACKRADGSSFTSKEEPLASAPEAGNYRIGTLDLDATLNRASLNANPSSPSLVQSCELTFHWTLRQTGQVAATLSRHGSIVAERSIKQTASYDARL
jgi:hypothetical protein